MRRSIFASLLSVVAPLITITSSAATAAVPAPPVNQRQGIPDGIFNKLSEPVCRTCHNQKPPVGIPANPAYLSNRHHLKVGMTIPPNSNRPYSDANGDGIQDTEYECQSCHALEWDPVNLTHVLVQTFRNCMTCHKQTNETTVHHLTSLADAQNCKACHGGLVSNPFDSHSIPTYQPSLVTPWPSGKPNGDNTTPANSAGTFAGNCNFCHNTHDGQPGQSADAGVNLEPTWLGTIVSVYQNHETHHGTGLAVADTTRCAWCHDASGSPSYAIRTCERCHGVSALHNVMADTNGDGVKPGAELPGSSHTGAQSDCWGCHGNNGIAMAAPGGGPGIPSLHSISSSTITGGVDNSITLKGMNFTNYLQNPWTGAFDTLVNSVVQLTSATGVTSSFVPTTITETGLVVTVPATVAPGNYHITAKKGPSLGNPMNLAITPRATIASATCVGATRILTVTGSNFSQYLKASDSGTSVTMNGVSGTVISWTGTEIRARFPNCPSNATATVDTVFNSVSASVTAQ